MLITLLRNSNLDREIRKEGRLYTYFLEMKKLNEDFGRMYRESFRHVMCNVSIVEYLIGLCKRIKIFVYTVRDDIKSLRELARDPRVVPKPRAEIKAARSTSFIASMFWYREIAEFPIGETTISETTTVARQHRDLPNTRNEAEREREEGELDNGAVTAALFLADVAAHGSPGRLGGSADCT